MVYDCGVCLHRTAEASQQRSFCWHSRFFDVLNGLEPVALLPSNPYFIVTNNAVPATNLKGVIEWLRANPGKASAATAGVGSAPHVIGVNMQNVTDTRFDFVPYRGDAPAIQDMIAGHIDLYFPQAAVALPYVQGGTIRAYAVTAKSRLATAPNIPTVDEAGLPGFYVSAWHGLWVPL
jgi:tripartite-type tricarboxylate transporter receptor subunit TctC